MTTKDLKSFAFSRNKKRLPKGKYKYVYTYQSIEGSIFYQAYLPKYRWSCYYQSEKKAAIEVDKFLINKGLNPINVLVPIKNAAK